MNTNPEYAEQQRAAIEAANAIFVAYFEELNKALLQAFKPMQATIIAITQEWSRTLEENKPLIDELLQQYEDHKKRQTPLI